jgi:hypothetical protein
MPSKYRGDESVHEIVCSLNITEDGFKYISKFKSLKHLILYHYQNENISDLSCKYMSMSNTLSCLYFPNCFNITSKGYRYLSKSSSITSLSLYECGGFDNVGCKYILKSKSIKELIVYPTSEQIDGIEQLCNISISKATPILEFYGERIEKFVLKIRDRVNHLVKKSVKRKFFC